MRDQLGYVRVTRTSLRSGPAFGNIRSNVPVTRPSCSCMILPKSRRNSFIAVFLQADSTPAAWYFAHAGLRITLVETETRVGYVIVTHFSEQAKEETSPRQGRYSRQSTEDPPKELESLLRST